MLNPFFFQALTVTEILKFLRTLSPAGKIFVSWTHQERANEKGPIIDHIFFSCDVRKGRHSKARSIESIVRSKIRRNRMHADSFLFISRVAASKNHTFFNHFLCLTIKHYRESSHIFAQCPFLTPRPIFGHIWPSGGLM